MRRAKTLSPGAGVVAGAVVLAVVLAFGVRATPLEAQGAGDWVQSQFERAARGESTLRVEVAFGAGRLSLGVADPGLLYRARIQTQEGRTTPVHAYRPGVLRVGNETVGSGLRNLGSGQDRSSLDVRLGPSVPVDLDLSMGAVDASLDLGGISIKSLAIATGASQTLLRVSRPNPIVAETVRLDMGAASFTGSQLGNLRARRIEVSAGVGSYTLGFEGLRAGTTEFVASMGIGSLEIRVPQGVGVEVRRSGLLLTVQAPDLERQGNRWVSSEWDRAATRLTIEVDGAIGTLRVTRIRP